MSGAREVRYLARHGESRVAKAVLVSAVPPLMVKPATNPGGLPKEVLDEFQAQVANKGVHGLASQPGTLLSP